MHFDDREDKNTMKKDLSLVRKELNYHYATKHASLQARLELSMAANDIEETTHLGKEKRLLKQLLYEACKKKILEKIEQGNMYEKDKRLEESQGLIILHAAQKFVLATQLVPFPKLVQSCEDQHTQFV